MGKQSEIHLSLALNRPSTTDPTKYSGEVMYSELDSTELRKCMTCIYHVK